MLTAYTYSYDLWQPLAIPGRFVIGEGMLTKICRKKPKVRQFFLFTDILVYGNVVITGKKVKIGNKYSGFSLQKNAYMHTIFLVNFG